ncbi:MAG: SDR family oxidoreductase [Clostridia bacterium]|nr:SDR family oxidoreductase [Clostridia bacterium]
MDILDDFNLSGKSALVAIPEGPYGRASALALCEAGASVYIASDNIGAAEEVAKDIKKQGFSVTAIEYDPASEQSIIQLRDKIIGETGKLDILVLNAGERFTNGWNNGTAEELYENLEKNQIGTMLITKIMGNQMAENKAGSIIFLSSVYAFVGPDRYNSAECPEMQDYDFSIDRVFTFGGYVNYARQAASYLGQFNIRVNTICAAPLDKPERYAQEFAKRTTLLRNAKENDIKGLVVYLASDASSFVSGTSIPVDGGYIAK